MTLSPHRPTRRYTRSWITQRLANRAPSWTRARSFPFSVAQQILNPIGLEIEKAYQDLLEARYNMFLSTTDVNLMDKIYEVNITPDLFFSTQEDADGVESYVPPTVYATINDVETEIAIAEDNDINTFWYDCLPTRIEDGEESYLYSDVIATTQVQNIPSLTPSDPILEGHLYITVNGNENWEESTATKTYYSKIWIEGTTRKGTDLKEPVPIRYNSTFKTLNQWETVTSIEASYLSDEATVSISSLPLDATSELVKRDLHVPATGRERMQFLRLGDRTWGSSLVAESYTTDDMDVVRMGYEEKDTEYEIELLDESGANVDLEAFVTKPNTDFIFAIDDTKLYVYDTSLPYPDLSYLIDDNPDAKIALVSERWVYVRDEVATVETRLHSFADTPHSIRWTLTLPNGTSYYVKDGVLQSLSTEGWILNDTWDSGVWKDVSNDFTLDQTGTYTIGLECRYYDSELNTTKTYVTKIVLLVPAITPEVEFNLPSALQNCTNLAFDSDGKLWFYDDSYIYLANIFYDYFMVDYEQRKVFFRDSYSQVRIVP